MSKERIVAVVLRADRILALTARAVAGIGGAIIMVLALFIVIDAVGRRYLSMSSGATSEVAGIISSIALTSCMAWAVYSNAHIRIDLFVTRYSLRWQRMANTFTIFSLGILAAFISYSLFFMGTRSLSSGETTLVVHFPIAIPQLISAVMAGFFAMTCLSHALVTALLSDPVAAHEVEADSIGH